jgi:hypothetical protein
MRLPVRRRPASEFQKAFARAGGAHAGVFAIVAQILADAALGVLEK